MEETASQLANSLKHEAQRLGFAFAGVCPAVDATGFSPLVNWLEAGFAGEMSYIGNRRDAYQNPRGVLPEAQSILMLGARYQGLPKRRTSLKGHGRVASYAMSNVDYHDVIREKLNSLGEFVSSLTPGVVWRGVVDTAPLLEREFASLAGIGWQGKNTMLIRKGAGSYFFIAAMLLSIDLPADQPVETNHCGTCTRCIDACPTNAIVEPYQLDARKCISYLTIELKGAVPENLRDGIGDWVFGCDVCQDVCPWNRFSSPPEFVEFQIDHQMENIELNEMLEIDDSAFRNRYRKTPFWRSRRRGLIRNAIIAAANEGAENYRKQLSVLLNDNEEVIRATAAWALGTIANESIIKLLEERKSIEYVPMVLDEIQQALHP
ncbi:MAG: tRNA epoxyqueuosine(34) reductase QueG [Pirellulaceae bacterium]